jgi:high-affinity nickel-transport protein
MVDATPLLPDEDAVVAHGAMLQRAGWLMVAIVLASVASIGTAALCSLEYPIIFGHAMLAFALGLRHAVDVDHLAAIDNVTRQLLSQGQKPVSVGFWFAVGHSSIVVLLTAVIAGGYSMLFDRIQKGTETTAYIGLIASFLSVSLLAGIGLLNLRIAVGLFRTWLGISRTGSEEEQDKAVEDLGQNSLQTAISSLPFVQRVFNKVDRPEKMFLVGLLFGLGFDTATQVGLIGMAAVSGSSQRIPPLMVMIFPLCFSCGMCFVDTANGLLMLVTYRWAAVRPLQKVFYNFLVTALSAAIALIIGALELLQVMAQQFNLHGPVWDRIESVDMGRLGYTVILTFLGILTTSLCLWQLKAFCGRTGTEVEVLEP